MTDADKLAEIKARHEWTQKPCSNCNGFGEVPHFGQMVRCSGPVHERTEREKALIADRATLLRMLGELDADFNERLGRVMEPHLAREARLREAAEAAEPLMQVAFLWTVKPPPESEVERYRKAYWDLRAALAAEVKP